MFQRFACLLFLCFCPITSLASAGAGASVCLGSSSGLSFGNDRVNHYKILRGRYHNCTIVKGNLEITGLYGTDLDVSFLQNIEVVTGYVIIASNDVPYLPLEKLKIIKGKELYKEKYALYVTANYPAQNSTKGLKELRLKSLTEITRGNAYITFNQQLCFSDTIHWNDIFNPASQNTSNSVVEYNQNKDPGICGRCDPLCEAGCWGRGPSMCQKLTLEVCSPDCGGARCRGPTRNDCCDAECAAGCTGPSKQDCQICLHVNNSGSCENACPPTHIYDPQTKQNIPNPYVKYQYEGQCVDKCPINLLVEENRCVKTCQVGFQNDGSGRCVPCKGNICDKQCYGVAHPDGPLAKDAYIDSTNIHHFKGCKVIIGNVLFIAPTFLDDRHLKIPPVSVAQLMNAFQNVEVITGYLRINSWPRSLTSFSVFKNLQRIDGSDLFRDVVALVIQDSVNHLGPFYLDQITTLGFRSLKTIKHGNVYIGYLRNLCIASMVTPTSIIQNPVAYRGFINGLLLRNNKPKSLCCNRLDMDIMFLIDGSGSISPIEFPLLLEFVKQVVASLDLKSNKVGVIQYSHWYSNRAISSQPYVKTEIMLGRYTSQLLFDSAIDTIQQHGFLTYTAHAIRKAVMVDLAASPRFTSNCTRKVIVVLTDGRSADSPHLEEYSEAARDQGVTIFAVGARGHNPEELQVIATGQPGNNERVYTTNSFFNLNNLVPDLSDHLADLIAN